MELGVDFIFARRVEETEELKFQYDPNVHRIWGCDPGITNVFVASDRSTRGDDPAYDITRHEIRKLSTAEFYTRAGYKKTNKRIRIYKDMPNEIDEDEDSDAEEDEEEHGDRSISEIENELLSHKTTNLNNYTEYLTNFFERLPSLLKYYDWRFQHLRFLNYQGRQRAKAEMAHIFHNGERKYNEIGMNQRFGNERRHPKSDNIHPRRPRITQEIVQPVHNEQKAKWRPQPFTNDGRIPIVAFGNAQFNNNMRGKLAGLANVCRQVLRQAQRDGLVLFMEVDEYLTSQVCSRCGERELECISLDDETMHSVQIYKGCRTLWQRDANSSRNIHFIAEQHLLHGTRPEEFQRSTADTDNNNESTEGSSDSELE